MSSLKSEKQNNVTDVESALYEITELGFSSHSMDDYYKNIHAVIHRLTNVSNFFIALYNEVLDEVRFVYFVDEVDTNLTVDNLGVLTPEDLRKSLTGHLLKTGKMLHVRKGEVSNIESGNEIELYGTDAADWLGVPLRYNNELLGAMVIQSHDPKIIFEKKEEDMLQFVSRQIALLIKSKLSEQELRQANVLLEARVKERTHSLNKINRKMSLEIEERIKSENIQSALFKITDLVSTTHNLDEFLKKVHQVISDLMYAENIYVALLSEDKYIEFIYYKDQKDTQPKRRKIIYNENERGFTEDILITNNSRLFNRQSYSENANIGTDSESYLGVPLINQNIPIGVLAVQSYKSNINYSKQDQKILLVIGKQIATAILRKKDSDKLKLAHELLEVRVQERTSELEKTIVKRKKVEEKLEYDSLHDALTGLQNRVCFSMKLKEQIQIGILNGINNFAVLFLDLDRFKLINDSLGHHIGDLFLIEISKRLKACLRENDTIARLGGDEFCILMKNIETSRTAVNLASRILKTLKKPVVVGKHSLITSASIGVRLSLTNESNSDVIMSDADAAMYQAKHEGKNCFCLFDSEMKEIVSERMEVENDLRIAVSKNEFILLYQPVFSIKTNQIVGCEALIRWEHPVKGIVSPDRFIPIAEETGIIVEIGEYVAKKAAESLQLLGSCLETKDVFININVSAVQILSRTFDDYFRELLSSTGVNPSLLNIEITESILIEDYKAALNFVRELKSMHVNIYLDDFGTGFSSLSYLHQFPFDVIKLDKSFVDTIADGNKSFAMVESIAMMANKLKMKIVAEGIEDGNQLKMLKELGFDYGQGFYFAKPMPLESLIKLIKDQKAH